MTMLTAVKADGFDREQWTTCRIGRLAVGDIFALPGRPVARPVVLLAVKRIKRNGESWDAVTGTVHDPATGESTAFTLVVNVSVPTRCDLHYNINAQP
ncbi:hypothetical protein ACWD25_17640 [Streptomyces sp. NPDC002920]